MTTMPHHAALGVTAVLCGLLGACGPVDPPAGAVDDAPGTDTAAASDPPGNPTAPPTAPPPGATLCMGNKLWFDGQCRTVNWLSRFVTPGATFVSVEGSRYANGRNAIVVIEAPNARTVRQKIVAMQKSNPMNMGRKYIEGHEVFSEYTVTQFEGEEGYLESVITHDARENGRFQTVWYERTAKRYGRTYRWSSDLCFDAYGDPVGYADGEACGPMTALSENNDSISEECELGGEAMGSVAKLGCIAAVVGGAAAGLYAAGTAAGGTSLILSASAGTGIVSVAAAISGADLTEYTCDGVKDAVAQVNTLICDALNEAFEVASPGPVAIPMEKAASLYGSDECEAVGGTAYQGGPLVFNAGDCASVESGGAGSQFDLLVDDTVYEVTVYGDRSDCTPVVVTANDNMCVVYSQ